MADRPIVVNVDADITGLKQGMGEAADQLKKFETDAADTGEKAGRDMGDSMADGLSQSQLTEASFLGNLMANAIEGLAERIAAAITEATDNAVAAADAGQKWARDRAAGVPTWEEFLASGPDAPPELLAAGVPLQTALRAVYEAQYLGRTDTLTGIQDSLTGGPQRYMPGTQGFHDYWSQRIASSPVGGFLQSVPVIGSMVGADNVNMRALTALEQIAANTAAAAAIGGVPAPQPNGAAAPSNALPWSSGWVGAHATGTAAIG